MTITVARRYTFRAEHHVLGLPAPWCHPHWHDYTVEVVAESTAASVLDTDRIDAAWEYMKPRGTDLNDEYDSTTVEALAKRWLGVFRITHRLPIVEITVWEDDERWGRART